MAPFTDDFLSVQEAARVLGVAPRTLLRWIREDRIGHRLSEAGEPEVPRADVMRLMATQEQDNTTEDE